jgi:curli biogenesis system outer membrane secretion channel CsgG
LHYNFPDGLIRMMIQQSNCFIVVERGAGMQNMMQERALADSGQLQQLECWRRTNGDG